MAKRTFKIAIDGPCGVGKSTTAIELAKKLGFTRVDSGMLYRAVTFAVLKFRDSQPSPTKDGSIRHSEDIVELEDFISKLHIVENKPQASGFTVNINYEQGSEHHTFQISNPDLRTRVVEKNVSVLAKLPFIRNKVGQIQREIIDTSFPGVIVDGRDIGTVVMPDADIKFSLTASENVRAKRRYDENLEKAKTGAELTANYDQILSDIKERDFNDINRAHGPLKKADDAILIDNSNLPLSELVDSLYDRISAIYNCESTA